MPAPDLGFETASWARRILALFVDWTVSSLVAIAVMGGLGSYQENSVSNLVVLGLFVAESALFTALLGGSFGQIATRLRVVRVEGGVAPVPLLRALARQVLVALVIPPLVYRSDGRGLHDVAAGSATVTLETWRALAGKR